MRITNVQIRNIGLVAEQSFSTADKPLILFYGEVKQGKSTILNAIRLAFGGPFPDDIIRHGAEEASVKLGLDCGGSITREFYRGTDGAVKSRPLTFIRNGERVAKPVEALKKFLNPFLLNQDFLVEKNEADRKAYFLDLFGVDTADLDKEALQCEEEAKELRAKARGYGDLDLTRHDYVDVSKLRQKLDTIKAANSAATKKAEELFEAVSEHNRSVASTETLRDEWHSEILRLEGALQTARETHFNIVTWLGNNLIKEAPPAPALQDTRALEQEISEAAANNVRHAQFLANQKRDDERKAALQRVAVLEARQRNIKTEKAARLAEISEKSGVPGLEFNVDGTFSFDGTSAGMLSTSQLMTLSSRLSALYPEGFGLDLIDRAESLGRTVFDFVKRAQEENKTILATIVGERSATVPENVGVFVVEKGGLK